MADGQKSLARVVVPALMALLVASLAFVLFRPKAQASEAPAQPPAPAAGQAATPGSAPAIGAAPVAAFNGVLSAKPQPAQDWAVIGSLEAQDKGGPLMRVGFNPEGAGILELALTKHHQQADPKSPNEIVQQTQTVLNGSVQQSLVPFAMVNVEINGQTVRLAGSYRDTAGKVVAHDWTQVSPGVFVAEIVDGANAPVAKITRAYRLVEGQYEVTLDQTFENLTDKPLSVRFTQLGPAELPLGVIRYGGDPRRLRLGIIAGPQSDAEGADVAGRSPLMTRLDVMKQATLRGREWVWPDVQVWPTEKSIAEHQSLSWVGLTNRFFAVTVHALPDRQPQRTDLPKPAADKRLLSWEKIDRVVLTRELDDNRPEKHAALALRGVSPLMTVEAGKPLRVGVGIYAGPIDREPLLVANDADGKIGLTDLEIYFWPGPCSFCTFQFIAYFLRSVLSVFANWVVFDWALAIILLVLCVRTTLHPITKWSQTSLQRFGKQMQKVGPKQKALQEKFKDDPARLRTEMSNLMREENVNYFGALGCLPMFLQTPVWIALSSLMFFLFDLRHTPAFFGLFQKLSGGAWQFMADLAEPDRFIPLGTSFDIPVLSKMMGPIDGINILPVLLGFVFFVQQKYLTPPPTTQLSPEMETQQKIMKVVVVFLFPIMMYNAPSGLALYFITNSTLGIIESRHIRKHFEKSEAAREELLKKDPHALRRKPGSEGFFTKLQARFAEAQSRAQMLKDQQDRNKGRS